MNLQYKTESSMERLQSTLQKMEAAFASILDCIVWTDREGNVQWCNSLFDQLVDRKHLDVLGCPLSHILPLKKGGFDVAMKDHPLYVVAGKEMKFSGEYEFVKADGSEIKLDIYAAKINLNGHSDESVVFVLRDVTDKRRAQESEKKLMEERAKGFTQKNKTEELEKVYLASLNIMADLDKERKKLQNEIKERERIEHHLRQLLVSVEQSPNTIMITDTNGVVQYVNPRFFQLTGYEQKDVVGHVVKILKPGQLIEEKHKEVWEYLRLGKVWKGEFKNARKNGEHYWEYVIISPVHDKSLNITNFLVIMQDISEQKAAEEKMKAVLEMKAEFTSTVSHELRTPLASIKGAIDLVMSQTAGPLTADQEKFLGKAKSNIDRLKRLIDEFLDLSKLESGKMNLDLQLNDMKYIIDDVLEVQKAVAQQKGLVLRSELPADLPRIPCDADKISQVFTNFINNAIKFTEKGEIVVSIQANVTQNHIRVCVSDTGEGIKTEDLFLVFEKFKQFGDPAKRKTGGTGLGLAICKEIIQQHNGKIWAESQVGKGSQFYFILPIEERRKHNVYRKS